MIASQVPHLTVLALGCLLSAHAATGASFFRSAEIIAKGITGNRNPIVHTAAAFDPTAQQAAQKTA
jgi:hypothetical protein